MEDWGRGGARYSVRRTQRPRANGSPDVTPSRYSLINLHVVQYCSVVSVDWFGVGIKRLGGLAPFTDGNQCAVSGAEVVIHDDRFAVRRLSAELVDSRLRSIQKWCENQP